VVSVLLAMPKGSRSAQAVVAAPAVNCAVVTVTLHPGLHPGLKRAPGDIGSAPDAPPGPFYVSLPVYPGAAPLQHVVGTPFPEVAESPYLQTAGLEYTASGNHPDMETWFTRAFHSCGYVSRGTWNGNTTPFSDGLTFVSKRNSNLSVEISFGMDPAGGSYIGYGVEDIILPARPARSYLHGPFSALNMAVQHNYQAQRPRSTIVHVVVHNRQAIRRLVSAIDEMTGYQTVVGVCFGGIERPPPIAPVWLSFVRPDGAVVHAFADGAGGPCGGGFAVNGVRWLISGASAWKQILHLARAGR
jgi:hypothetical protein